MPITPEYDWEESAEGVVVRVKTSSVVDGRSGVFATDCSLKINSPPYLLVLDLFKEVDEAHSTATVEPTGITFRLRKVVPEIWGRLIYDGDRNATEDRRTKSIERAHARLQEASKQRLARKAKESREANERKIEVDRRKRSAIEAAKAAELEAERSKLANWQAALRERSGSADSDGSDDEASQQAMPDHPDYHGTGWKPSRPDAGHRPVGRTNPASHPHGPRQGEGKETDGSAEQAAAAGVPPANVWSDDEEEEKGAAPGQAVTFKPLPPPRIRLEPVKVEFTKLEMPHLPAREQREAELKEYKKREVDKKLLQDSSGIEDRTPMFLKDKGDALYKQGNFRGAINAYDRALQLDDTIAAVWSNMAACHMQLGDPGAAALGCSRCLELMEGRKQALEKGSWEPQDMQTFKRLLVRTLSRRAAAFCKLHRLEDAAQDLREAMRYDSGNESLRQDLEEVEAAMQPLDAVTLRKRGDARFKGGDHEGAAAAYSLLLQMDRGSVPAADWLAAIANRSACLLLMERFADAAGDCDLALTLLLSSQDTAAANVQGLLSGLEDAQKLRSAVRLLTRRGAARGYLKHFDAAVADFRAASHLLHLSGAEEQAAQVEADLAALLDAAAGQLEGNPPPQQQICGLVEEHTGHSSPVCTEDCSPGQTDPGAPARPAVPADLADAPHGWECSVNGAAPRPHPSSGARQAHPADQGPAPCDSAQPGGGSRPLSTATTASATHSSTTRPAAGAEPCSAAPPAPPQEHSPSAEHGAGTLGDRTWVGADGCAAGPVKPAGALCGGVPHVVAGDDVSGASADVVISVACTTQTAQKGGGGWSGSAAGGCSEQHGADSSLKC